MTILTTQLARLDPRHCAVLVIDMQNDFCAEGGYIEEVIGRSTAECRAIVEPLTTFLNIARNIGVPIAWVRAIYDHDKLPAAILAKHLMNGGAVCCGSGTPGAAFYGVGPNNGEAIFDKHSYSAFSNPELIAWLNSQDINSLIFTGVQTNVCVESSVRDAVRHNLYAAIASDCVASHTTWLHDATLANVKALFGDVLTSTEINTLWEQAQINGEST